MKNAASFGILDASPIRAGGTLRDALLDSVFLAKSAEKLGYSRYWFTEHHNSPVIGCTAPDVLMGQIANHTKRILVGSGGIMLLNHSPLRIAETANLLTALFPNRIELGIGRARGSDEQGATAFAYPDISSKDELFHLKFKSLLMLFSGEIPAGHPYEGLHSANGLAQYVPDIWFLASGESSAKLAGELGLKLAFADFFYFKKNTEPSPIESYHNYFQPSIYAKEPEVCVALDIICAETREEAQFIGLSRDLARGAINLGLKGMLHPKDASLFQMPDSIKHAIQQYAKLKFDGDVVEVKSKIEEAMSFYKANHVLILSSCFSLVDRLKSYELIANAFNLNYNSTEAAAFCKID